jgi:hypothetical protein
MASASKGSKVIPRHIDSRTPPGTFGYKKAVQHDIHFVAFPEYSGEYSGREPISCSIAANAPIGDASIAA